MTPADFDRLAAFIRRATGVVVPAARRTVVEANLAGVLRTAGVADVATFMRGLLAGDPAMRRLAIDAVMTPESLFFRDQKPFDEFRTAMLGHFLRVRPADTPIRIWCAAVAGGQEAYSLAILLHEMATILGNRPVEIHATDISEASVARAKAGLYSGFEIQRGLSTARMITAFEREGGFWRIRPEIGRRVRFSTLNLIEDFSHLPVFDIIFCRNVLMYFDTAARRCVLERIERQLQPDGFLVLGGAESVFHLTPLFRSAGPGRVACVKADGRAARRA